MMLKVQQCKLYPYSGQNLSYQKRYSSGLSHLEYEEVPKGFNGHLSGFGLVKGLIEYYCPENMYATSLKRRKTL